MVCVEERCRALVSQDNAHIGNKPETFRRSLSCVNKHSRLVKEISAIRFFSFTITIFTTQLQYNTWNKYVLSHVRVICACVCVCARGF